MTDLLIRRDATFGHGDTVRWTLTREWDDRLPKVCFLGHNPSRGSHLIDDPTSLRWNHFGRAWGFGGWVAVNMYPVVATDPAEARRWADWENAGPDWYARDMLQHNLTVVAREAKAAALVVACWGAIMRDDAWVEHVIEEVMDGVAPWPSIHVFGLTMGGCPIHPMARGKHRVANDALPVVWRLNRNATAPLIEAPNA